MTATITLDPRVVYQGSDGDQTRALYTLLDSVSPLGMLATALFRAQKCSDRAKLYGRNKYRGMAYDRKQWSLSEVCRIMAQHAKALPFRHGWREDETTRFDGRASWVLYVDTPCGQASFHAPARCTTGPLYDGEWIPGEGSREVVLRLCESVLQGASHGHA